MAELLSYDEANVQWAWDSTSIKLAAECLRKYQLKNLMGWQPARLSVHLRFGQHYATALEHYFKKRWLEGMDHDDALVAVVHEALIDTWDYKRDDDGNIIPGSGWYWDSGDTKKNRATLIRTIVWYLDEFVMDGRDPTKVAIMQDGSPAVELSFELPVDNGISFCGHLDRLTLMDGAPYVMDQKTTGNTITPYYFDQFKPDDQMSMYTFAGTAMFETPVAGVIIDAAQIAVGFSAFERGFTHRTPDELDEWYDNTMHIIESAQRASREGFFPMNATACNNFGGCQFRKVCSMSPQVRPNILAGDFKQEARWDPLQRR